MTVELIEADLDAKEREKKEFFEFADRLARSTDPKERERLKEELTRMTFGSGGERKKAVAQLRE